jgi:hypothetical protein
MRRAFDRLATATSVRLVEWTRAHVDDSRSEWVAGLSSELTAIEGGWKKLAWAIGGLPLAWSFRRNGKSRLKSTRIAGDFMNGQQAPSSRSGFESFVLNIASLGVWWLLFGLWVRAQFPSGMTDWRVAEITTLAAAFMGVLAALAIRRIGAAYVLGGFVAFQAIELGFHLQLGIKAVQGGQAHFGNMTAGMLGATIAALAIRQMNWSAAIATASVVSLAVAEGWIRIAFGWHHTFRDGYTNYALAGCAVLGSVIGVAIGKWGGIFTIQWPTRLTADRSSPPASAEHSATP